MPVTPTYPGVYIEEIPSGVRTITGVATSITAFIGRAKRGPTDKNSNKKNRAVTINSFADFERIYGGLWRYSSLGYAVRDFFLNGGSQAIIVRLYHSDYATDDDRTAAQTAAQQAAQAVADAAAAEAGRAGDPQPTPQTVAAKAREEANKDANKKEPRKTAANIVATAAERAAALDDATASTVGDAASKAVDKAARRAVPPEKAPLVVAGLPIVAAYEGAWGGNLRGAVDFDVSEDVATRLELSKDDLFNLTIREEIPEGRIEQFRNLSLKPGARRIDKVLEAESSLVRWGASTTAGDFDKAAQALAPARKKLADAQKELAAAKGDETKVKEAQKHLADAKRELEDPVTAAEEVLAAAKKPLTDAKKRLAAAQSAHPQVPADIQKDVDDAKKVVDQKQADVDDAKGDMQASDGGSLDEADFTGQGKADAKGGLYALKLVDLFNILCIPPYLTSGDVDVTLVAEAAAYCEARRAMLLVDPPSSWINKEKAKTEFLDANDDKVGTRSKNAALFFPRLKQPDPLRDNQIGEFVPCGAIAGIFARTDTERGVWKAPAGLDATLRGVPQLSVSLTDLENGELNPLGINCLRAFPAAGRVVWGARTLQGNDALASEWKYIPVRRLALYIEESLYRGTQWVVFEPNDEPLWSQIRLNVGAFMHNLFRQGAFQGTTPQVAYFVKCDKETTTQNDINLGIVNIVVGFAPLKPAEFVIIKLQQMAGQIQV